MRMNVLPDGDIVLQTHIVNTRRWDIGVNCVNCVNGT